MQVNASQLDLFSPNRVYRMADPQVRDTVETPRLSRQCEMILALLKARPVSNRELSGVALKYTSRISDLRAAGYNIQARVDRVTGLTMYHLQ